MKKAYVEQTIAIRIPVDPSLPAEVECSPGPYADEAKRLAAIPGSGWGEALVDRLPERVACPLCPEPFFGAAKVAMKADEPPSRFLVDHRLVAPKPLRKSRPDASERMRAYNRGSKTEDEWF